MDIENIRNFSKQERRVETGAIRFGNDGAGIFIRGDNALAISVYLKKLLDSNPSMDWILEHELQQHVELLQSCNEKPYLEL